MRFLFYGLAAYILYLVIRAVSVASQVWRWVLKPVRIEPVESFPDNVRPLFKNAVAELTGFGFEGSLAVKALRTPCSATRPGRCCFTTRPRIVTRPSNLTVCLIPWPR